MKTELEIIEPKAQPVARRSINIQFVESRLAVNGEELRGRLANANAILVAKAVLPRRKERSGSAAAEPYQRIAA